MMVRTKDRHTDNGEIRTGISQVQIEMWTMANLGCIFVGSGCGTVGRMVASDTRGPRFESSHQQLLLNN